MAKRFLIKLVIFCALPFPLLYLISYIVDEGLRKSKYGLYTEWNDIFNSRINADVLVMGSSRAWVHISPHALDTVLGVNSYNLGLDGWNVQMQLARYRAYVEYNKKPAYVIYSMDLFTFDRRKNLYNYQQFLPYLHDTVIRNATKNYKGEFTLLDYYVPLYKYRDDRELIIYGMNCFMDRDTVKHIKMKGYQGKIKDWDNTFEEFRKKHNSRFRQTIYQECRIDFENYLNDCKKNNIQVIIVYSPEYIEAQKIEVNRDSIIGIYKEISEKFNCPFIDFSNDPISMNRKYFYNSQHMNKEGSEIFSIKLAQELKKYILKPHSIAQ